MLFISIFYFSVSLIMRNSRYRRDPRQLEEDEEMWFNDEDEIEDEEPVNEHKDLDDEFDQIGIGKILEKRGKHQTFYHL